jgi:hypothetical protein
MSSAAQTSLTRVVVNLYGQTPSCGGVVNVWKVQKAPSADIMVGQKIWFESAILSGDSIMGSDEKGTKCGRRYEGEVQSIAGWQKSWVRFHVGGGEETFQLWVPLAWTAMGFMLRLRHFFLKRQLVDDIPPLPPITRPDQQTRRVTTSGVQSCEGRGWMCDFQGGEY